MPGVLSSWLELIIPVESEARSFNLGHSISIATPSLIQRWLREQKSRSRFYSPVSSVLTKNCEIMVSQLSTMILLGPTRPLGPRPTRWPVPPVARCAGCLLARASSCSLRWKR
jgi:hypothetical protein